MIKRSYIAIIHKEKQSDYGVSFPDFPGCISSGKTLEEAKRMAEEVLNFHVQGMIDDSEEVPLPSELDDIKFDKKFQKDIYALLVVDAKISKPKVVRVNVTIDEELLDDIDNFAAIKGVTRSAFLSNIARRELNENNFHAS
jgi:predicted RNase H-like HicB family nuclease